MIDGRVLWLQALIGVHFKFTAITEIYIWACGFDR